MAPDTPRPLARNAALDGVRAVAIIGVLAYHLGMWRIAAVGEPAMDLFFALSGFLITSVLIGEKHSTARISLPKFYARRALRLFPALAFFLGVWLAVIWFYGDNNWVATVPGSSNGAPVDIKDALQAVGVAFAYVFNWFAAYPLFRIYIPLGHLWSLSVEEQFYIVWAPLLVLLCSRRLRRWPITLTVALASVSLAEPLLVWQSGTGRIYFGTDTRAGVFLLGAVAAMAWKRGLLPRFTAGRRGCVLAMAAGIALGLAAFGEDQQGSEAIWLISWVLASASAPYLVAWVVTRTDGTAGPGRRSWPLRVLTSPVMRYIGKRSYGLYLWHYAIATWTGGLGAWHVPVAVAGSLACAEISWRLVESPALSLKKHLSPKPAAASGDSVPPLLEAIPDATDGGDPLRSGRILVPC